MLLGLLLVVATLLIRSVMVNRHVRARLTASAAVAAVYVLLAALLGYTTPSAGMQTQIKSILPLLVAFSIINGFVALIVNPWRDNRLPDRFPTIAQDGIVVGLFVLAATLLLQERILAATAATAVVVGLALQDTLGNLFAGLSIQIEKPFRVGHWVQIAGTDGLVSEITWRGTRIRTKAGNFVVVPNRKLADDSIINYSEPTRETRLEVMVGASYDAPPNRVKAVILDALNGDAGIPCAREPEVLLVEFAASAITYRVWVWTTEFDTDFRAADRIISAIYYAFRRHGIVIPYPIQTQIWKEDVPPPPRDFSEDERQLHDVAIFSSLDGERRAELARATKRVTYAGGELIARQGEAGSSMFVVVTGSVVVILEPGMQEVARMGPGGFLGEMSLLTGAPRSATVRAVIDSDLLEITADAFRSFVLANPEAVEHVASAVATRQEELEHRRAAGQATATVEPGQTISARIRRFLRLGGIDA